MAVGQNYNVNVDQLSPTPSAPKKEDDDGVKNLINKLAKQASNAKLIQTTENAQRQSGVRDGIVRDGAGATNVDGKAQPGGAVKVGGQSFQLGEGISTLAPGAQKALGKLSGDPRFANLPLGAQSELAKLFARDPQLAQQVMASFTAQMSFPGADKAFNTPLMQGEAMLVTIGLMAQPGGEKKLKDLEGAVQKFSQAYGNNSANERTKLMMFREVVKTNSPQAKAALEAAQLIDKGGSQESLIDIVKSAASDPGKAQDKLGALSKLLSDPKITSTKDGGAAAKAVTDFVGRSNGGRSQLVELEKFIDQSKLGNVSAATIRNFAATTGTSEGNAERQISATFQQPKTAGAPDIMGLLRKRSEKADKTPTSEKLPPGVTGVRPRALPPIEAFDPQADPQARDQKFHAQFAVWQQRFHERETFVAANSKTLKRLGLKDLENVQKEVAASGSFEAAIGAARNPQELSETTGCDIRLAEQIFKWDSELKDQRAKFSKEVSMARRMARAKGNKAELRTERPPPAPREVRLPVLLDAQNAQALISDFRQAFMGA